MLDLGWFSTGRDEAARELLRVAAAHMASGDIKARISFVFSNREPGESDESDSFFQLVRSYRIPLVCFSSRRFSTPKGPRLSPEWRTQYHQQVMQRLEPFHPQFCVLAGYMLIASDEMCQRYTMINLHPARPGGPAGTWQEVIWQLLESGATETGVTIHLVTRDLDRGPAITYCTFPIVGGLFDTHRAGLKGRPIAEVKATQGEQNPLFQLIRQEGVIRELPMMVATLKALGEGKIRVKDGMVLDSKGQPIPGYCLTAEIERSIARGRPGARP